MTIGFEELQALNAIMEEGSFRAAAEKLHKAQSSISYAIKILEKELGIEIFDRSTYKPTLTSPGEVIYTKTREMIAMQSDLEELSKFLKSGVETSISLTTSIIFPINELSETLSNIKAEFSQTKINLDFGSFQYPLEQLYKNQTDIAIAVDYTNESDLEKVFFRSIDLIPVYSPDYCDKNKSIKSQVEIVVGNRSLTAKKLSEDLFEEHETWHVTDYSLKKKLILDKLGWGYMPEYLIQEELEQGKLEQNKKKNIEKINLYAYRKQRDCHGPATDFLWASLLKQSSKDN